MEPKYAFVFYLLALLAFLGAAFYQPYQPEATGPFWRRVYLVPLGLALVDFVLLWATWKAI